MPSRNPSRLAMAVLQRQVRQKLAEDATGHDLHHVARVRRLCEALAHREGGDLAVIDAAALLHDLYRPEERQTGALHFGPDALAAMDRLLRDAGFPEEKIPDVLHCVAVHEQYGFADGGVEATLEARILQDADRLDAIGAIGIARAFMFAGAHGRPMWSPDEVPSAWNASMRPGGSAITHFHEKLLKLAAQMNTTTARAWAEARHEFMEEFLEEFKAEWEGRPSRHVRGAR